MAQRLDKPLRKAGVYPSLEKAIAARAKKGITRDAAACLGERGITKGASGYYWHHDQRLTLRSLLSMTDEQVAGFLAAVRSPVLVIVSREASGREHALALRTALVADIQVEAFSGGHHQHLDGDVAGIAALIESFLGRE